MKNLPRLLLVGLICGSTNLAIAGQDSSANDAAITQNVQNQLAGEQSLSGETINVNTQKGMVSLSGTLDTDTQAGTVIEIVEATPGVKNIDYSALTVKGSQQPLTDTGITAQVKGLFLKEKLFGNVNVPVMNIHVETKNGIVYLTGTADNKKQIGRAVTLAKSVKGVKYVDNKVANKV